MTEANLRLAALEEEYAAFRRDSDARLLAVCAENERLKAEVEKARRWIEDYECDYDAIMRGEKCAMELAIDEANELRRIAGELAAALELLRRWTREDCTTPNGVDSRDVETAEHAALAAYHAMLTPKPSETK